MISHVNLWAQPANCEFIELKVSSPLQICWDNDLHTEMCAKSDLGPFQHHTMNIWYEFRICCLEMYIDWYTFVNLYLQKVYCLV